MVVGLCLPTLTLTVHEVEIKHVQSINLILGL